MIALWLLPEAAAVDRWVDTTSPGAAGTGPASGSYRYQVANASPNDVIKFKTTAFPAGTVTPITLSVLPTVVAAGVYLQGDGRVAIECATTLTAGSALTINADNVIVTGMELRGCPDHGVQITGDQVVFGLDGFGVPPNKVHDNQKLGVLVTGLSTTTSEVLVTGNDIWDNCLATTASCAGVGVRKGSGAGSGPVGVAILNNRIDGHGSGGHGVGVFAGADHQVSGNEIGLVAGNSGNGITVAANTGVTAQVDSIDHNVVVNNTLSGILLGARSSNTRVEANLVGTDGTTDLGNARAGIEVFASDDHSLADNVVSGNNQHVIWVNGTVTTNNVTSPAESILLEGNFVGTDESGLLALPNGQDGIQLVGYGSVETFHQVRDNVVAANGLAGIHVLARRVTLRRNLVGVNAEQEPLGNATDGIRLSSTAAYASVEEWNVIGDNGGDGIEISADDVVVDHAVLGTNLAGGNTPHPQDFVGFYRRMGNGGAGIRVNYGSRGRLTDNTIWDSGGDGIALETSGFSVIDDWTVSGNEVRHSGGSGLSVAGIIQAVEWLENRVSDSGACPYDVSPTANSSLAAPTITTRTPWRVAGTHAGAFVWRVDVYVGEDEAERWVGRATLLPGNQYELVLGDLDLPIPDQARVIAIASTSDGRSSPAQGWCAEGCAHAAGSNSCYDGDFCTQDTCGGGGCTWPNSNAGLACDDGDACTTASTCQAGSCKVTGMAFAAPGTTCIDDDPCSEESTCKANGECSGKSDHICDDEDPCTQEVPECSSTEGCPTTPRPIGYQCEDGDLCTVHGTCDSLGACVLPTGPPVVDCPMDTQCNDCVCVPEDGCSCTGICGDGKCGPDDFFAHAGGPCPECLDGAGEFDDDHDGFPNIWEGELTNIDIDCDGTADYGPGTPRDNLLEPGVRDLFLEIDYMADGQSGEAPLGNPAPTHEHYPYRVEDNTGDSNLVSVFAAQGIALHVDISDELPHTDLVSAQPHRTPLWREGEWVHLRDLRRAHFDYRKRRGLYHYQVIGHQLDTRDFDAEGLGEFGDESVVGIATFDRVEKGLGLRLHEFGHNLGLGHGGLGGGNHEPNYVSSMNYGYPTLTLGELEAIHRVDYSWNELLPVDEEAGVPEDCAMWCELTPTEGPLYNVTWECPPDAVRDRGFGPPHAAPVGGLVPLGGLKMDLDCNGILSDTAIVTHPLDPKNRETAYEGGDDWASIDLAFQGHAFSNERFSDQAAGDSSLAVSQHWPRTALYPGGAPRVVPRVGAAYRVPIVVYGAADFDATAFTAPVVRGATAVVDAVDDFDLDGFDDRWLEFRAVDLVGLASTATSLHLYTSFPSNGDEVYAKWPITRANSPADTDGDGLQNAVDACDDTPPAASRGPDGCPWP
jgi:parallel beta-helix repeat protein